MDYYLEWFYRNTGLSSHTLIYNIPRLLSINPTAQCAFNIATTKILKAFEDSLNDDGYEAVDEIVIRGNYYMYIELLVEKALSEAHYTLECSLSYNIDEYYTDDELSPLTVIDYIAADTDDFQETLIKFAFFVFTGVISNVICFVKQIAKSGIFIDTYKVLSRVDNSAIVDVSCFIDTAAGLLDEGG